MDEETFIKSKAKTPEAIHNDIRYMLENGVSYLDALVEYASQNNMEIEALASIVKGSVIIKEKLREEAISMRLVDEDDDSTVTIRD